MEDSQIDGLRKTKAFQIDFFVLIAVANGCKIQILNGKNLSILAELKEHCTAINCLDISCMRGTIISCSSNLIIIHKLSTPKNKLEEGYDKHIHLHRFRWRVSQQLPIDITPLSVSISFIGDLFAVSKDSAFSIWAKNQNELGHPYRCTLTYDIQPSQRPNPGRSRPSTKYLLGKNIFHKSTLDSKTTRTPASPRRGTKKEIDIPYENNKIQLMEITTDGRLLVVLREYSRIIDVWCHISFESAKGINEAASFKMSRQKLQHELPVIGFKTKHYNYYESTAKYIPNVIITLTADRIYHFWVESFANDYIQFYEFEVLNEYKDTPNVLAFAFFQECEKGLYFPYEKADIKRTKMQNAHLDKSFYLLKEEDELGILKPNHLQRSVDWLLLIYRDTIYIYRIDGMRDFPPSSITLYLKMRMNDSMRKEDSNFKCQSVFYVYSDSQLDKLWLFGFNEQMQILKWKKSFGKRLDQACKVKQMVTAHRTHIKCSSIHKSLPISAIYWSNRVEFLYETIPGTTERNADDIQEQQIHSIGHFFLVAEDVREIVMKWLPDLPLLMLCYKGKIEIIGPDIYSGGDDHGSTTETLINALNMNTPYRWKVYYIFGGADTIGLITTATFGKIEEIEKGLRFSTNLLLASSSKLILIKLEINNIIDDDELEFRHSLLVLKSFGEDSTQEYEGILSALPREKIEEIQSVAFYIPFRDTERVEFACATGLYIYFYAVEDTSFTLKWKIENTVQVKWMKISTAYPAQLVFLDANAKVWFVELKDGERDGYLDILEIHKSLAPKGQEGIARERESWSVDLFEHDNAHKSIIISVGHSLLFLTYKITYHGINPSSSWKIILQIHNLCLDIQKGVRIYGTPRKNVLLVGNNDFLLLGHQEINYEERKIPTKVALMPLINSSKELPAAATVANKKKTEKAERSTSGILCEGIEDELKMYPLYHPFVILEFLKYGEYKKIYCIIRLLYDLLKAERTRKNTYNPRVSNKPIFIPDLLNINISTLFEKNIEKVAETKVAPKKPQYEDLFDDFFDDDQPETEEIQPAISLNRKRSLSLYNQSEGLDVGDEETIELNKADLISLMKESVILQERLSEYERSELLQVIENMVELMTHQISNDEIGQQFMMHMKMLSVRESKNEEEEVEESFGGLMGMKMEEEGESSTTTSPTSWISTMDVCLAYHSVNQDVLYQSIFPKGDTHATWKQVKKYGLPLWVKDVNKLKNLLLNVATTEFREHRNEEVERVHRVAIWYIALNRKQLLLKMYKNEHGAEKVYNFMVHDFSEPRWKKGANSNAYTLLSQKKYLLSASFFLLANNLPDCLQILIDHLKDIQMAVMICRLIEGEQSPRLKELYKEYYIGTGRSIHDPWLCLLGHWLLQDYIQALNSVSEIASESDMVRGHNNNIYSGEKKGEKIGESAEWPFESPVPSVMDPSMIILCKKLEKSYHVQNLLQKESTQAGGGGDSIFDDFFTDSPAQVEEEKTQEIGSQLKFKVGDLIQKGSERYWHMGCPYLSLYLLRDNEDLLKQEKEYVDGMCAQILAQQLRQLIVATPIQDYTPRKHKLMTTIDYFNLNFHVPKHILKQFIRTKMEKQGYPLDALHWALHHEEISEDSVGLIQRQVTKLVGILQQFMGSPFMFDSFGEDQDNTKKNVEELIEVLEQINDLMGILDAYLMVEGEENVEEDALMEGPGLELPMTQEKKFPHGVPEDEEEEEEEGGSPNPFQGSPPHKPSQGLLGSGDQRVSMLQRMKTKRMQASPIAAKRLSNLLDIQPSEASIEESYTKFKLQIGFLLHMGLIILSYSLNKFFRAVVILAKISLFLEKNNLAWNKKMKPVIWRFLQKFKRTLKKPESLRTFSVKEDFVASNDIADPDKGTAFFILWGRQIIMKKCAYLLKICQDKMKRDRSDVFSFRIGNLSPNPERVKKDENCYEHSTFSVFRMNFYFDILKNNFFDLQAFLQNYSNFYLEHILTIREREAIAEDINCIFVKSYAINYSSYLQLTHFFKKQKKLKKFAEFTDIETYVKSLRQKVLSLVKNRPEEKAHFNISQTKDLYQDGIELYKMKGESINGFGFSSCSPELLAIGMGKGTREMNIQHSLVFRGRTDKGLKLLDEEMNNWRDTLHRFDHQLLKDAGTSAPNLYESAYQPLQAALSNLFPLQPSIKKTFVKYIENPPLDWNGRAAQEFIEHKQIDDVLHLFHEEPTYALAAHPHLPLYLTGFQRGIIGVWKFNDSEERLVEEMHTSPNYTINTSKSYNIAKIKFNFYGDKFASSDYAGNFYTFKLDKKEQSVSPYILYPKMSHKKTQDFEFLNQGSVICATGLKPGPHLSVWDTLRPSNKCMVASADVGGTLCLSLPQYMQILLFNPKSSTAMSIFDLRMQKIIDQGLLAEEKITSVSLNRSHDALITGDADGQVKIWNVHDNYQLREKIGAFPKKTKVTQVTVTPSDALFASSNDGSIKLLRVYV